jgi:rSAM/selenodomain-associated transferase 1
MMRQALVVAAKAPQPGTVKTRLCSLLSSDDATELYRCFLEDTFRVMNRVPGTQRVISYTPEGSEAYFQRDGLKDQRLLLQRGDSFGERLFNAFEDLFSEGFGSVIILNADSPTLPVRYLTQAFEELARAGDRVVLGPADDGGYYLIGLKRAHRVLFERITWSSDRVLAETLERARESAIEASLLPAWYDVDDAEGLERLLRETAQPNEVHEAMSTRSFIEQHWPSHQLSKSDKLSHHRAKAG